MPSAVESAAVSPWSDPPSPGAALAAMPNARTGLRARRLAAYASAIRDDERQRLGREMHDALGAQLTALQLAVARVRHRPPAAGADWQTLCDMLEALVNDAQTAAERIVDTLHPPLLDAGLCASLQAWLRQFARHTGLDAQWHCASAARTAADQLPPQAAGALYRIAQEALANASRHARARHITLTLRLDAHDLVLSVRDDGIGFVAAPTHGAHRTFGLQGMRERCVALGGRLDIDSRPGAGTDVCASIPLRARRAALSVPAAVPSSNGGSRPSRRRHP